MTLLAFVVVLSVLILVHELGHFLAAKSVDIAVPRFSLGLGPKVIGFRRGETEYVLSALPLGGYVKMAGMEDTEMVETVEGGATVPGVDPSRHFDGKPLWARAWVISAGVIFNLVFSVLVFFVLGITYGEPIIPLDRIAAVDTAQLRPAFAALAKVPEGARIVAVGDQPVRNWSELLERVFSAPAGPTSLRFEGLAPVPIRLPAEREERARLFDALVPLYPPSFGQIEPNGPAARAGLRPGDRVVAANGKPVTSWQRFVEVISSSPGRPITLRLLREGRTVEVTLVPRADRDPTAPGGRPVVGRVGVGPEIPEAHRPLGFGEAAVWGVRATWATIREVLSFLGRLFSGGGSAREVGGIVAIGQMSGQAARLGMEVFLTFLARFSVNLAVLNLLPIPILDGGHLVFLAAEGLRGRPLSVQLRMRLLNVGFWLLVGIMLLANGNDIVRILGN